MRLPVLLLPAVALAFLTGCGDDSGGSSSSALFVKEPATLAEFCYALEGLNIDAPYDENGEPGTVPADLIQERIDLLEKTGVPEGSSEALTRAVKVLVKEIRSKGDKAVLHDLDAVEDPSAPSPFDGPGDGLTDYREDSCDEVYIDELLSDSPGTEARAVLAFMDRYNQSVRDGDCNALAGMFTEGSVEAECSSHVEYEVIGGGIMGPETAEVQVRRPDGEEYTHDKMYKVDGEWKFSLH